MTWSWPRDTGSGRRLPGCVTCWPACGARSCPATAARPVWCCPTVARTSSGSAVTALSCPAPTVLPPGTVLVAARFRPGAGGVALGVPLSELLDQRIDVADLRRDVAGELPA